MQKYELDFLSPDGSSIMFEIIIQSSDDKSVRNAIKPILLKHYLESLIEIYSYSDLLNMYNEGKDVSIANLEKIVWSKDRPLYKCLSCNNSGKIQETTCSGCLYEYANQLGHMDKGGCLYSSSYSSEN